MCFTGSSTVKSHGYEYSQPSGRNGAPTDLLSLLKTEVLHSPPISHLPKNILKAPAHNPTDPNASSAYEALPNPSPAHPLRRPDQRFLDSEVFTNKFASHLSGPMEKVTRRTMKRWSGWFLTLVRVASSLLSFLLHLCLPRCLRSLSTIPLPSW